MAGEDKVKVWDARQGKFVLVPVNSAAARGKGHGVTVQPKNTPAVKPSGGNTVNMDNWVTDPYSGRVFAVPGGQAAAQAAFDKARIQGTPVGMTSQAPGGWNPAARFGAMPGVKAGDTGDTGVAGAGTFDLFSALKGLMQPSTSGSGSATAAAKPTISLAVLEKAMEDAKGSITSAYDAMPGQIDQIYATNPYANLQSQQTTVDPGLADLFQSQGVDATPLQQLVAANRESASQRANSMNDMYKLLAAQYAKGASNLKAAVPFQKQSTLDELLANYNLALGSGKVGAQ